MTKLKKNKLSFSGCAISFKQNKQTKQNKNAKLPKQQTKLRQEFVIVSFSLCDAMSLSNGTLLWCVIYNFLLFLLLGDWTFIVNGRKRSYVLHAKLQEEATRWANAIQEVN